MELCSILMRFTKVSFYRKGVILLLTSTEKSGVGRGVNFWVSYVSSKELYSDKLASYLLWFQSYSSLKRQRSKSKLVMEKMAMT